MIEQNIRDGEKGINFLFSNFLGGKMLTLSDKDTIFFKPSIHCPLGYSLWISSN